MTDELGILPMIVLLFSGGFGAVVRFSQIAKWGAVGAGLLFGVALLLSPDDIRCSIPLFEIDKVCFGLSFCFGMVETVICLIISAILCCLHFADGILTNKNRSESKLWPLNIFVFFMCMAVFSNNLFQFYVAVEAMGLISTMIVGLGNGAILQATRVFAFNKFASLLFLVAVVIIAFHAGGLEFENVVSAYSGGGSKKFLWPSTFLMVACLCKGAQIPFSHWLVDAVKANTSASILIHSGTIVGVGIIFITKFHFMFEQFELLPFLMVVFGACTFTLMAFRAAIHNNVKKIMARLTASSTGSMFIACGLKMYSLSTLTFVCHALFKAALFMGFAHLISLTAGEQNIYKIGSIKNKSPKLTGMIWGVFAIAVGLPFAPGFFAKVPFIASIQTVDAPFLTIVNVAGNILATVALFRLVMITLYGGVFGMSEITLPTVANQNKCNLIPVWSLVIVSILGSLYAWSMYSRGNLRLCEFEIEHARSAPDCFMAGAEEMIQIVMSVVAVLLIARFSRAKAVIQILRFVAILNGGGIHERFCGFVAGVTLSVAKTINIFNEAIGNIARASGYRLLRSVNVTLSGAHQQLVAAHVIWVIFGLTLLVAIAICC
jgi:NADH:ubiquinone oxidoreductase subunit 5 (subunit L)/multisubunit Na+/H+ antiporter MnhA subunit